MSSVAIITARGGSKRIPRKNIRPFRGRPMIAWSIEAALKANTFTEVMVSTDDDEIAEIARSCGAKVPFMRSPATSDDFAGTVDVLVEVLEEYRKRGTRFDLGCCLYPTAPLVTPADLLRGRELLEKGRFDAVMPVAAFSYPIWRSLKRDESGRISLNFPENLNRRSQDLPPAYHDAGQWYWFRTESLLRDRVIIGQNTGSVLLSELQVQDIDNEDDWALAEMKHRRLYGDV